jgi:hypothetical protein
VCVCSFFSNGFCLPNASSRMSQVTRPPRPCARALRSRSRVTMLSAAQVIHVHGDCLLLCLASGSGS